MDTKFEINIGILLEPVYHLDPPEIVLSWNNKSIYDGKLSSLQEFTIIDCLPPGSYNLDLEFVNKTNEDTIAELGLDKAVKLQGISLNKIKNNKFVWEGIYRPVYPEPWASQQREKGIILPENINDPTYLGWNGIWTLQIEIPVFTWIHRTLSMGWIYD